MEQLFTPIPLPTNGWAVRSLLVPSCSAAGEGGSSSRSCGGEMSTHWQVVAESPRGPSPLCWSDSTSGAGDNVTHDEASSTQWIVVEPVAVPFCSRTTAAAAAAGRGNKTCGPRQLTESLDLCRLVLSQQLCRFPSSSGGSHLPTAATVSNSPFREWLLSYAVTAATDLFGTNAAVSSSRDADGCATNVVSAPASLATAAEGCAGSGSLAPTGESAVAVETLHISSHGAFVSCVAVPSSAASLVPSFGGDDAASSHHSLALVVTLVGFQPKKEVANGVSTAEEERLRLQRQRGAAWGALVANIAGQLGGGAVDNTLAGPFFSNATGVPASANPDAVASHRLCLSVDSRVAGTSLLFDLSQSPSSTSACNKTVAPQLLTFTRGASGRDDAGLGNKGATLRIDGLRGGEGGGYAARVVVSPVPWVACGASRLPTDVFSGPFGATAPSPRADAFPPTNAGNSRYLDAISMVHEQLSEASRIANTPSSEGGLTEALRERVNSLMAGAVAACEGIVLRGAALCTTVPSSPSCDVSAGAASTREKGDGHISQVCCGSREWLFPPRLRQRNGLRCQIQLTNGFSSLVSSSATGADVGAVVPFLPTLLLPTSTLSPLRCVGGRIAVPPPLRRGAAAARESLSSLAPYAVPFHGTYGSSEALLRRWIAAATAAAVGNEQAEDSSPVVDTAPSAALTATLWLPRRTVQAGNGSSGGAVLPLTPPSRLTHIPLLLPPSLLRGEAGGCGGEGAYALRNVIVVRSDAEEDTIVFVFARQGGGSGGGNITTSEASFSLVYTRIHDVRSVSQFFDLAISDSGAVAPQKRRTDSSESTSPSRSRAEAIAALLAKARDGVCEIAAKQLPTHASSASSGAVRREAALGMGYLSLRQYRSSNSSKGGDDGGKATPAELSSSSSSVSVSHCHLWARESCCGGAGHLETYELVVTTAVVVAAACDADVATAEAPSSGGSTPLDVLLAAEEAAAKDGTARCGGGPLPARRCSAVGSAVAGGPADDAFAVSATFIEWLRAHISAWLE